MEHKRTATPGWLKFARITFLLAAAVLLIFGFQIARLYTDWQWFHELGQPGVFSGALGARLALFFGLGALFFLATWFNLWLAMRLNAPSSRPRLADADREAMVAGVRKVARLGGLAACILLAFLVAGNATTHWSEYLLYTHSQPFGKTDPVFGADISFYTFRLPFLLFLQGWVMLVAIISAIAAAVGHLGEKLLEAPDLRSTVIAPAARRHIMLILAVVALASAWGQYLSRYDLLLSENGAFFGAGYADLSARLPATYIQVVLMTLVAFLCVVSAFRRASGGPLRPFAPPLVGMGLWILGSILAGQAWPAFVQRFTVVPNQFTAEAPYIRRDIDFTRAAYGLDHVREETVDANAAVTGADLKANEATTENIRLWDWPQLGAVYEAKQALTQYYRFRLPGAVPSSTGEFSIDVDRYRLKGDLRQVMLAAREIYPDGLQAQAQTWVNQRLVYTHGYGIVMSPVNRVDADGYPEYFLGQIPVQSTRDDIPLTQPRIYYGELSSDYVFVDGAQKEFDFRAADGNKESRYEGKGGVPIGGFASRMAWAVRLGDTNLLLSNDVRPESRILYRRNIRQRVETLAPFLNWDNDPYLVLQDGRPMWILDGYTVTDRYPYSRPSSAGMGAFDAEQSFNYIRNSVKAVVDAYDGSVTLYAMDDQDPILRTWRHVFPGLFTPADRMAQAIRDHLRYPEDLFRIQRDIYTIYHITDERVYYGKEDQWAVPNDPTPGLDGQRAAERMAPYYVVMRPPGEKDEEFILMTAFTPLSTQNMLAWMCAKCDPAEYGQLVVYRFPKGKNVNGPQQIMGQVLSDETISKSVSLLNTQGSRVIWGNLLVIPVEGSLLYAMPLYVTSDAAGAQKIPLVRQVILASGDRVVMRSTLAEALTALVEARGGQGAAQPPAGAAGATPPPAPAAGASAPTGGDPLARANEALARARQREREYQAELEAIARALKEIAAQQRRAR